MIIKRKLIVVSMIAFLALLPAVNGIKISVSSNAGGFSENIHSDIKDSIKGTTIISKDSLSNSIESKGKRGNLIENHWVSNSKGALAGIGVVIKNADYYKYEYILSPKQGGGWPSSKYPEVTASEALDVNNANYIKAYSNALNLKGDFAIASIEVADPEKKASLSGYSNLAIATAKEVTASQQFDSVSGDQIKISSWSQLPNLQICPLELSIQKADASINVRLGSITDYSSNAIASIESATAFQDFRDAFGEKIQTGSSASTGKKNGDHADAAIEVLEGSMADYSNSASAVAGINEVMQESSIAGESSINANAIGSAQSSTIDRNKAQEYLHFKGGTATINQDLVAKGSVDISSNINANGDSITVDGSALRGLEISKITTVISSSDNRQGKFIGEFGTSAINPTSVVQDALVEGNYQINLQANDLTRTKSSENGVFDRLIKAGTDNSGPYILGMAGYYYVPPGGLIQPVIDASDPGDTIEVAPGLFSENINIWKSLVLDGAGNSADQTSSTILNPSASPVITITAGGTSETDRLVVKDLRVSAESLYRQSGIYIKGSDDISHVTLKNVASIANGDSLSIMAHNGLLVSDVDIDGCTLVGLSDVGVGLKAESGSHISDVLVKDSAMSGSNSEGGVLARAIEGSSISGVTLSSNSINGGFRRGVYLETANSDISNVNINNNHIENVGKGIEAIASQGTISNVILKDNEIINGNNGAYLAAVNNGKIKDFLISGNTIDHQYNGIEVAGSGDTGEASGITMIDNKITNMFHDGVFLNANTGKVADVTIGGGNIKDCGGAGIELLAQTWVTPQTAFLTGVTINGVIIENSGAGVDIGSLGTDAVLSGVTMNGGTITGSRQNGVHVYARDGGSIISPIGLNNMNIYGNGYISPYSVGYGILNEGTGTIDATNNWWGSLSGPKHWDSTISRWIPTDGGDAVSANVDYQNWRTVPV